MNKIEDFHESYNDIMENENGGTLFYQKNHHYTKIARKIRKKMWIFLMILQRDLLGLYS